MSEQIVIREKFDGKDFSTWKFKMEMLLLDLDVWEVVEIPNDKTSEAKTEKGTMTDAKSFAKKNQKALSVITQHLSDRLIKHIKHLRSASDAWMKLKELHESKQITNRLTLRLQFISIRMAPGSDMLDHINKVRDLASQLRDTGVKLDDEEIIAVIFLSLPDQYNTLTVALQSRKDIPDLEEVCEKLINEHNRQAQASHSEVKDERALVAHGSRRGIPGKRDMECFFCKKKGHIKKDCRKWKAANKENDISKRENTRESAYLSADREYLLLSSEGKLNIKWCLDSGATQHMTAQRTVLENYRPADIKEIYLGDNSTVKVMGQGDIKLTTKCKNGNKNLRLSNVLHIPALDKNLISIQRLAEKGVRILFDTNSCDLITGNDDVIGTGKKSNKLYYLNTESKLGDELHVAAEGSECSDKHKGNIWHKRLSHLNNEAVKYMWKNNMAADIEKINPKYESKVCESCAYGKITRTPSPKNEPKRASKKLELVHSDICGPMSESSHGGQRYFITFIDDFSRMTHIYFLKQKSECLGAFQLFVSYAENLTDERIKTIRSDNGTEYMSKAFQDYIQKKGIRHQTTAPHSPQQNGVAERVNRTIVECARTMLIHANLPKFFWAEAVNTAIYTKNRSPHKALPAKTPLELWTGAKPKITHMRIFGCDAYARDELHASKLDSKARKCIFLGYCDNSKAYRLLEVSSNKFVKSRNVIFDENTFSNREKKTNATRTLYQAPADPESEDETHDGNESEYVQSSDENKSEYEEITSSPINSQYDSDATEMDSDIEHELALKKSKTHQVGNPRRSLRLSEKESIDYANIAHEEPENINAALKGTDSEKWQAAIDEELKSLKDNHTWDLVELPQGRKAIANKWVFKLKCDKDGNIIRYKARLVAKGFTQIYGIDYTDTFAPTAKLTTIRFLLSLAATRDYEVQQLDVKTAFLNGKLTEEIYMLQPEGCSSSQKELVCKLNRGIYGLKQAGRAWYATLSEHLRSLDYRRVEADHSVFTKTMPHLIIVCVYVDDFILIAKETQHIDAEKAKLAKKFDLADLGEVNYLLGLNIERDRTNRIATISQERYIADIIKRFRMDDAKPCHTPMALGSPENKDDQTLSVQRDVPYQSLLGSLMYIMLATRPDIAFAIGFLSRYSSTPTEQHWNMCKRVIRYLKATATHKLHLGGNDWNIHGYADADWAGDVRDRKSTTGYVFTDATGAISWSSKKQTTIALSTVEAEYVAYSEATREATWLVQLSRELNHRINAPLTIFGDNQGAIQLIKNPTHHSRTKHIDMRYHYIRDKCEDGTIMVTYLPTDTMTADVLTKPLGRPKHESFTNKLGLKGKGNKQDESR